jgi:hypothetical protein
MLAATIGAGAATAAKTSLPLPVLEFDLDADVSPKSLPKKELAPAGFSIFGRVGTRDGSYPSALREIVLNIDKDVEVDFRGLPVCKGGRHDVRRRPDELKRLCREAIVGTGEAKLVVSFPNLAPIRMHTELTAFNLGIGSRSLAVVGAIGHPAPALIVAVVKLRRLGRGWRAIVRIPRIAGGAGSLVSFRINLKRFFFYRGERKSFLSARCPDGVFKLSLPKLLFRNEARIPGVAAQTVLKGGLAVPCGPMG